MFNNA